MPIRYKVTNSRRDSCFMSNRPYELHYAKGKVVSGHDETKIFVFKLRRQAEAFRKQYDFHKEWKILRVEGIGRGTSLPWRPITLTTAAIQAFWRCFQQVQEKQKAKPEQFKNCKTVDNGYSYTNLIYKNDGTMLYDAVRVLD